MHFTVEVIPQSPYNFKFLAFLMIWPFGFAKNGRSKNGLKPFLYESALTGIQINSWNTYDLTETLMIGSA